MYETIRNKMQGLSHYGAEFFTLDETAKFPGYERIASQVEKNIENANQKRDCILSTLKEAVSKLDLELTESRRTDLIPGFVECIDTGSTGRGTNMPGSGDFDFMVRLDRITDKNHKEALREALRESLSSISTPDKRQETGDGDFRYKGVTIPGLSEKVDIDLTFTQRTNEIEYSSEECINDRLATIQSQNPETYRTVLANILLAKKFMKEIGAYKKANAPAPEKWEIDTRGGLGAIGIENWILQNGGSFEKASRSFLRVAGMLQEDGSLKTNMEPIDFTEFTKQYSIWDYGENWKSIGKDIYPHDNFVNNMSKAGYHKMIKGLEQYMIHREQSKEKVITIQDIAQKTEGVDSISKQAITKILDGFLKMDKQHGGEIND